MNFLTKSLLMFALLLTMNLNIQAQDSAPTLAIEEIDTLIKAIDLSSKQGERNRAIIETLYGCGLRVSELTNLKISDLYFEEGFIKSLTEKTRKYPAKHFYIEVFFA